MGLFKGLFGNNDWVLLNTFIGKWNINHVDPYSGNKTHSTSDNCHFEIEYSPSRNIVKLKCGGYRPKDHELYSKIGKIMSIYNIGILSKKPFPDIKKEVDESIKYIEGLD